jgi:Protein of unknown function (DUF4065)
MFSRTAQLIQYFVQRAPGCGRTRLVKFIYLADHESRRFLGRALTDLQYRWDNHGPFTPEILRQVNWMRENGNLTEQCHGEDGYVWYEYRPTEYAIPVAFRREERAILDHILAKYADMKLGALLDDIVYQTRPMQEAKMRGETLNMSLIDNEQRTPGMELEKVLASVDELEAGGGAALEDMLKDL